MQRTIGLWGAVVTLVGFVIGVSVFLLPGELAATAGPGVIISYAIASVIALFACVISAQIGAVLPVSGAGFVFTTKMTSPFLGFLMVWLVVSVVSMAVALVAHGFSGYFELFAPGVNKMFVAVAIVVFFGGINLLGAKASVWAQTLMVVLFMTVLLVFSGVGVVQVDGDLLVPFVPNGYGPVLLAAVPAFFSYSGFGMIVEIGGEIKNPSRTIPWALAISFLIVWLCYTAVALVIVGHIPWSELTGNNAPVATVAAKLFPGWAASLMTLTILAAAATSINGILLGYSRDIYVMSRVRLLPERLSALSKNHGEPHYSVALLTATSVVAVLIGARISEYATVIVLAIMVAQILQGVAMLRLHKVLPGRLSRAAFRLRPFWLGFFTIGLIIFSAVFLYIGTQGSPGSVGVLGLIMLLGAVYYGLRKAFLASRQIKMESWVSEHIEESIAALDGSRS